MLTLRRLSLGLLFTAFGAAGCAGKKDAPAAPAECLPPVEATGGAGDDATTDAPAADVSGNYTVTLTNSSNTCATETNWVDGTVTTDVRYDIRQAGSDLTAEAQGNAAAYFVVLTGSNDFSGTVRGNSFELTDVGPNAMTAGACTYTINAVVNGSIDGDTISGTLIYRPAVSGDPSCNPDCAPYVCEARQDFVGSRASQ